MLSIHITEHIDLTGNKKMKNIKFAALGMVALSIALSGCHGYQVGEKQYEITSAQKEVVVNLTEAYDNTIYNVKSPIDVVFKAPEKYNLIVDGKLQKDYKVHINPQESINMNLYIQKNGEKKPELVEARVDTYKDIPNPENRSNRTRTFGKMTRTVGENVDLAINKDQKNLDLELHEYNKKEDHYFYLVGGSKELVVKMIAPKYTSFVFENGNKAKEHIVKIKEKDDIYLSMKLIRDKSLKDQPNNDTYFRNYNIKFF
jgi:D-hexose-6-phosphate mutarotase